MSIQEIAKERAEAYGLDPALVCAVIEQESNWNPWAIRYEPAFFVKYVVPIKGLSATEQHARSTSWGAMQVMGQVAREAGFAGHFLSELCEPHAGIDIGCKVLKGKLARAAGDVEKGLLYWNGGGNPEYVKQVMARMNKSTSGD